MRELKEAIVQSTSILLVLPDSALDRDYLAALQIQHMAPDKIRILAPTKKEEEWQETLGITPRKKEFAIIVDTAHSPVDELRYEKDGDNLLILLSHRKHFDPTAVHMEEYIQPSDLIITIGFDNQDTAERFVESLPHKPSARHLWMNGRESNPSTPTNPITLHHAQLMGRILARSREDKDLNILWSFLTREDFEKTFSNPSTLMHITKLLEQIVSLPNGIVVAWQQLDRDRVSGLLWSHDKSLLELISRRAGIILSEDTDFCLLPEFDNFVDAENAIRKLLRSDA